MVNFKNMGDSYTISGTNLTTTYPPKPNDILTLYGGTVIGINGTSGTSGTPCHKGSENKW
jgi:hypothetical protein